MSRLKTDMTQGNIVQILIKFSIPFLLSNLLQALYSVADMIIVGNMTNAAAYVTEGMDAKAVIDAAVAGVMQGGQITHLITMMVSGLTVGGTVLVAQYFGAHREDESAQTIGTMFSLLAIVGAVITIVTIAFSRGILSLLGVDGLALEFANRYLIICAAGTLFIFGYNAVSAVQRGMGDSKRPMIFIAIACTLNVGLDMLLVPVMGPSGAALATIAAQGVSFLIAVLYLARSSFVFDFRPRSFRIHKDKAKMLVKIGLPASVQSVIVNFSFLFITALVNARYPGGTAMAAVGIVGKFNAFGILPAVAMSQSVSSVAAQNIGAGLHDRARKALYAGSMVAFAFGLLVFLIAQLFPESVLRLFGVSESAVGMGVEYLSAYSFDYLVVPFVFCINGLLTGSGHTQVSLFNAMLSSLLLRVPVALLLSVPLGLQGVGIGAPAASLASFLLGGWYVLSGRWLRDKTGIRRQSVPREA